MKVNKKLLYMFMRDKHPITFKRWMHDAEEFRDGKARIFVEGKEKKFDDEWSPLNDLDFKADCEKFGIKFRASAKSLTKGLQF